MDILWSVLIVALIAIGAIFADSYLGLSRMLMPAAAAA